MPGSIRITSRPTRAQLDHVGAWLKQELGETGGGFFVNWHIIQDGFRDHTLRVLLLGCEPVALLLWGTPSGTARIDILTVKPSLRGHGFGRLLVESMLRYFERTGHDKVTLECTSADSESFCRRLGFVDPEPHEKEPKGRYVQLVKRLS